MNQQEKETESTQTEKFVVRFPPGMRNWIASTAYGSHRSMNAEIVARLHHSRQNWPAHVPLSEPRPVAATDEDQEARLLAWFRRLSAARREALLCLLD